MKKNTDHIILSTVKPEIECKHCGAKQAVVYPMYMDIMLAIMKAWIKMHRHCEKPIKIDETSTAGIL